MEGKDGNGARKGTYSSGGGAGTIGGFFAHHPTQGSSGYNGENGTGGLLIIYANELINNGKIEANGKNGGTAGSAPGGSSGGGSINLFYSNNFILGEVSAKGGDGIYNNKGKNKSGAGGNGTITPKQIQLP